jgi:hypothetical protein
MTQQVRNTKECVTINDKTLFVHLLVISVFVYVMNIWRGGKPCKSGFKPSWR